MYTNDEQITDLMKWADKGKIQLPDFQRGWVWDDDRIRGLIASITNNFPVGAAMFLNYGNENVRFKYHGLEGSKISDDVIPDNLILDGQQRLTSIYSALVTKDAVSTTTTKGEPIKRHYYISIEKALDSYEDRLDAIISIPENLMITSNFGKKIELDLTTREKEFEQKLFPLNIILNHIDAQKWQNEYYAFYKYDPSVIQQFTEFYSRVVMVTMQYKMPVIYLEKDTPKEAVCQVFENVNTGGVALTVFELVTAIFAMDDFDLRSDWRTRKEKYFDNSLLKDVSATDFLTSLTLLYTYKRVHDEGEGTVSAKKKDVLSLPLEVYKKYADALSKGFVATEKILEEERIFSVDNLPYSTQLVPMAALCTLLEEQHKLTVATVREKIKRWYWCGVFGELYGGANTTRFVNDINDVMKWVDDEEYIPKTIADCFFSPTRLLSLQTRQSAAYKGLMALILQNHAKDFISGLEMDFAVYKSENPDIHHIFPKAYCEKQGYDKAKWNSVINKTPITYRTNREIGGVAPSKYLEKIENAGKVTPLDLNGFLLTHYLDVNSMRNDDFETHIILRAKALLDAIENATGKKISGRDSEDTIARYGQALL